ETRARLRRGGRGEEADVRCLVPGPHPSVPALAEIAFAHDLTEGENTVIAVEVEGGQRRWRGRAPVMRVVEQQLEARPAGAHRAKASHERGLRPLVHQHEVGAVHEALEIRAAGRIRLDVQVRVRLTPSVERRGTV